MNTNMSQLMTVDEAADFLRLKPSTIRSWHTKGKLPRLKIGSRVFVHRQVCEALIEGKTQPAIASLGVQAHPQLQLDAGVNPNAITAGKGNLVTNRLQFSLGSDSGIDSAELVGLDKSIILEPKYLQQMEVLAAEWRITTREVAYRLLKSALDRVMNAEDDLK